MSRFNTLGNRLAIVTVLAALLGACASPAPVVVNDDDTPGVRVAIRKAAERADVKKSEMKDAEVPASLTGAALHVRWDGEAAEILQRIALAQGLKFRITGSVPRLQIPVHIDLRNVTLEQALEAIGDQCGRRADVFLTDSTIELHTKLH